VAVGVAKVAVMLSLFFSPVKVTGGLDRHKDGFRSAGHSKLSWNDGQSSVLNSNRIVIALLRQLPAQWDMSHRAGMSADVNVSVQTSPFFSPTNVPVKVGWDCHNAARIRHGESQRRGLIVRTP